MNVRILLEEGPFDTVKEAERFIRAEVGASNAKVVPWIEGYGIECDSGEEVATVAGYFRVKFARWNIHVNYNALNHLEYVRQLPVDSECGASCIIVADKAAELLYWLNDVDPAERDAIIAAAAHQCQVFYTA